MSALAGLLAGLSVALALHRPDSGRLFALLAPGPAHGGRPAAAASRTALRTPRLPLAACLVLAAGVLFVVPLVPALPLAVAAVVWGPRLLARLEPAAARERAHRLRDDLPLLLDLLAACLAGGASMSAAASAVAPVVGGVAGERLAAVAAALQVGTPPPQAWASLGGASDADPLAPAARALSRAAEGGAPVAGAVSRLADEARRRSRAQGEAAARRVGVLAVAPLGLCFLPAFVLLGVVPVVAGLAGPLLRGG